MRIERMEQWHQIYLLPTIRITHDKFLYGFYNIELFENEDCKLSVLMLLSCFYHVIYMITIVEVMFDFCEVF